MILGKNQDGDDEWDCYATTNTLKITLLLFDTVCRPLKILNAAACQISLLRVILGAVQALKTWLEIGQIAITDLLQNNNVTSVSIYNPPVIENSQNGTFSRPRPWKTFHQWTDVKEILWRNFVFKVKNKKLKFCTSHGWWKAHTK